jgi:hypothetical protein
LNANSVQCYNAHDMNGIYYLLISAGLSSIALAVAIYAFIQTRTLRTWRRNFGPEEQPENLEQIITSIAAKIKALETSDSAAAARTAILEETLSHAIQHAGLVRFDSHSDEGGALSFSLALLDAHRTGFIITSLYGRQHNRIYTKQIREGTSESHLTEEEQAALFEALGSTTPRRKKQTARQTNH